MKSVNFYFKGLLCPVFTPFSADKWVLYLTFLWCFWNGIEIELFDIGKPSTTTSSTNTPTFWSKRESKVFWSMEPWAKVPLFVSMNVNASPKNGGKCAANTNWSVSYKSVVQASLKSMSSLNTLRNVAFLLFSSCQTCSSVRWSKKIWSITFVTSRNIVQLVHCTTTTFHVTPTFVVSSAS